MKESPAPAASGNAAALSTSRPPSDLADEMLAFEQTVLRLITRNMPLPALLAEVCRRAEAMFGEGPSCSILLLDGDGTHTKFGAAPSLPDAFSAAIDGLQIGPGAGSCGTAMFERRMVVVEDIATDPLWDDYRQLALPIGLRACWSIPFLDDAGKVLGAFAVYYRVPRQPTAKEETILRNIGQSVGLAVHQDAIAQRLAHSEEHHRFVVDLLSEGILVLTPSGIVLACNPSAQRMFRSATSLVGSNIYGNVARSFHDDGSPIALADRPTSRVIATGQPVLGQVIGHELIHGEILWVSENVVPIIKPGETTPGSLLVSFVDIGPVRDATQRLKYLATRDSLTGLFNRGYLADRMTDILAPGHEDGQDPPRVAIVYVDLDGFKLVNDSAGHETGDALLRSVARRLSGCVREDDTLARVGGDEFVIVIRGYRNTEEIAALATQLLESIALPFTVGENAYFLGASIGISLFPEDGRDAATLLRNADSAMYYAKQLGRNSFQFFTAPLNLRMQRRFAVEQSLRRALTAGELSVVYQPIVDGQSASAVSAEALLRWHSAELGHVSPDEFIPVAEETGMIVAIGQWVLERACAQAAEWRRTIAPDLSMAVNLSPRQINAGLVQMVQGCLQRTGLEPGALELEITEGLLMMDSETVMPALTSLTRTGVRISVDDFGTGYSSLSYLKRFPLHNLKIDRSFVAGLPDNRDSTAITRAVVAMAHSLGMSVTAEGVETPEQAAYLRSLGCERQQGFLFCRPVEPVEFARRLGELGSAAEAK
ncbi:putative bifunctional diguanylate cyclase/phosphodiesterase [Cupriavidus basilensis]|uniref:Diguanylate cyclase/phosphodiesterase (GGDEF & EAL domains) with PAS/PAC sensor(S) n=1 Tax=Cupriavidus basilensis TaxID=68895 RepID=A0A0C4Y3Q9_9BURK|nr:EAL domain-containing protein [Cupriavidus basilensis]AJG17438.1 diguanylate cyclase/phosphodiesterase (GGDEF & EAL domains) with PAS/PAC sensor(s) [Cupriavidus basilensis]